jgi:DNA-binding beta-propeller fold protein YncE
VKTHQTIKPGAGLSSPTNAIDSNMKRFFGGLMFLGLFLRAIGQARAGSIYWTDVDVDVGDIRRANFDGSGMQTLISNLHHPWGIGLDLVHYEMYWVDYDFGNLLRANLDGSGSTILAKGLSGPVYLALDLTGGKIYWPNDSGKIQRANLDGSGLTNLVSRLYAPRGIALDLAGGMMYWTDAFGYLQRANLDGTGVTNLVSPSRAGREPVGMALDAAGGKVYWATGLGGEIRRANLDGTGITILVHGLDDPADIALDLANGKMYWADRHYPPCSNCGDIRRANLDGSGMETLISKLPGPARISLDPRTTVEAPVLRFASQNYSKGQFHIQLVGTVGQNVVVQTSTNLVTWASLSTNILKDGAITVTHTNNLSLPHGFYRALALP